MSLADNLLAFTLAASLLTLTPGLDTALILRTAAVEGRAQAWRAALGINAGCLLWGAAVAFGLGALLAVSELAYTLLKYCGAAYLCWLGLNLLLRPRNAIAPATGAGGSGSNWFLKGMLGNVLNPKVGIFYVSFLPQFIPRGPTPDRLDLRSGRHPCSAGPALVPDPDRRHPHPGRDPAQGRGDPLAGPGDGGGLPAVRRQAGVESAIEGGGWRSFWAPKPNPRNDKARTRRALG